MPEICFFNSKEELSEFLAKEPKAERFVRKIYGSDEFINSIDRWCLWLKDVLPTEWRNLPEVMKRVQAVRDFRSKSKKRSNAQNLLKFPIFSQRFVNLIMIT